MIDFIFSCLSKKHPGSAPSCSNWFVRFDLVYIHTSAQQLGFSLQNHTEKMDNLPDSNHSDKSNISDTDNGFSPIQIQVMQLILNSFIKIVLYF